MPPSTLFIAKKRIHFEETASTNLYLKLEAEKQNLPEGTVVSADYQSAGRGQRGTVWEGQKGKNAMLSILLCPAFLDVKNQFLLSQAVAVALWQTVKHFFPSSNVKIKWPNDILIDGKKTAGILIENTLSGSHLRQSIIGVGLNINQTDFGGLPATSLAKEAGKELEIKAVENYLFSFLEAAYLQLKAGNSAKIKTTYLENLYQLNKKSWYKDVLNDTIFEGIIRGAKEDGKLLMERDGAIQAFDLKEVGFDPNQQASSI